MRFGFVTAVELGLGCLEEIYRIGGSVDFLMTLLDDVAPDKSGRVSLDEFGALNRIPLHKVRNINDPDSVERILSANLDLLFIIGWSQIARSEVLAAPANGCIGMHPTLLPEGRGRASIPWAILKGLDETGVTMFRLDEGMDTGPILAQRVIPIGTDETAATLYKKVADAHRSLVASEFPGLRDGVFKTEVQDQLRATVWPGRTPADGRLRPTMTVEEMDRLVRATTRPYPGAFIKLSNGTVTTVWAGQRVSADVPHESHIAIAASDGVYWATETESRHGILPASQTGRSCSL